MNVPQEDIRNNLKLLIELSCVSNENNESFKKFHKMLITIFYEATDVCIDYTRSRIDMNVVAEDAKGDFLWQLDNLVPNEVCLNLGYENLCEFLKESITDQVVIPKRYYALLKEQFLKGKSLLEKNTFLERLSS